MFQSFLSTILALTFWMNPNPSPTPTHEDILISKDQFLMFQSAIQTQDEYKYYVEIDERFVSLEDVTLDELSNPVRIQMGRSYDTFWQNELPQYYTYEHALQYYASKASDFAKKGYRTEYIGKSIEDRDLLAIFPEEFSEEKQRIIMFGRHHGDEGTANWIIEGFVNAFLSDNIHNWANEFQFILYPMINPDGAVARIRYNAEGKDLNRQWSGDKVYEEEAQEIADIHMHLDRLLDSMISPMIIAWDMHGSFVEDFIYRVNADTISQEYFDHQTEVIEQLAEHDPWQDGNFHLSDGHPRMARIVLARTYGFNSLTHETPRDIDDINPERRDIDALKLQGWAIYKTIWDLYY